MIVCLWNSGEDGRSINYVVVPIDKEKAETWLRLCDHMHNLQEHHRPPYGDGGDTQGSLEFRFYEEPDKPSFRGCIDTTLLEEHTGIDISESENDFINIETDELPAAAFTDSESFEYSCLHATGTGIWWEFLYFRKYSYTATGGVHRNLVEEEYNNATEILSAEWLRRYLADEMDIVEPVRPTSVVIVNSQGEN